MNSQYNNDHLLEVNCNQSTEQNSIPVIGVPIPNSIWRRDSSIPGSSEQQPFCEPNGWYVGAFEPVQTQSSQQDEGTEPDLGLSGTSCGIKQFESDYHPENTVGSLQSTSDVSADTDAVAKLASNDSCKVLLPCDENNASSGDAQESLDKDDTVEATEEKEEDFWIPKVLWTEEMIALHARVKLLSRKWGRKKQGEELYTELKVSRSKFKYWYKTTLASMKERPDFEELKKMGIEEKKNFRTEKLVRIKEHEERKMKKQLKQPLLPEPPLMNGPPLMPGPPYGPMRRPSGNRRHFNRRQRDPAYYSNPSNGPRFAGRINSGWTPESYEHYMRGYQSGFMSAARTDSDYNESPRHFNQGSSSEYSGW